MPNNMSSGKELRDIPKAEYDIMKYKLMSGALNIGKARQKASATRLFNFPLKS